jgi:glycosyltransferase involved in cell wall biosynthesis
VKVAIGVFTGGPSGVPVSVLETAAALRAAGTPVTLLVTAHAEVPAHLSGPGIDVVRLEPLPRRFDDPRVEQALHLPHRLLLGRRVGRALRDRPSDVLHLFSPGAAATLGASPPVVVQSWFTPPTLRGRLGTMMPLAPRDAWLPVRLISEVQAHLADVAGYRRAALVLANTEVAEQALRAAGLPARTVPPSITVPAALPRRRPGERLRVVFCAYNLATPRKGLGALLKAMEALPPGRFSLTLVGGGAERLTGAVERARAAGVEVVALGRVPRERYLELLAADADLLAMPSRYEEWGYAAFEALSRGVPVLALRRYPFDLVLDARTGLLADDAAGLAAALRGAAEQGLPAPETIQDAARERFGAAAVVPRLLDAYAAAAAGRVSA